MADAIDVESDFGNLGPNARKVIDALANPKWDFRTVDGIARDTGLSAEEIQTILDQISSHVRRSMVPDRSGRTLYTLKSRPAGWKERIATLRFFATGST